ncbi:MAG: oligosaccharide flippase family protein [Rubricoccaceae bacterium]|nr:oligosaccharide flippase family protein [Rubricoccaceae bacterium]
MTTDSSQPDQTSLIAGSGPLTRLVRQGGMYTLSNLGVKLAGFILLAFYLDPATLSQADYGRFQLLEIMAQILILVGGMGLAAGLLKFLHDDSLAEDEDALPATTLVGVSICAVGIFVIVWLVSHPLATFLVDDPEAVLPVRLAGGYVALKLIGAVPFMVLRAKERAGTYALIAITEAFVLVGAVAYMLVVRRAGLDGVMIGYVISAAVSAVCLSGFLLAHLTGGVKWTLLRPLFRFGMPLALAGLAAVVLNAGDRYVLKLLTDAEVVAVYGLAAKYGGLVNMLFVQSFNLAFSVIGLKALRADGEGATVHRRTFRHYVVLTGWGVLGVSLLARDVTDLLSPNPAFLDAEPLVLPLALGFMAYGIYYIGMNVLYAEGQSRAIAGGVTIAAIVNIVLNLVAIPLLGVAGAALTSLLCYAGLAAITMRRAVRTTPVDYHWLALGVVLLFVLGLWMLAQASIHWAPIMRILFRLGLISAYPALVLVAGIYRRDELRRLGDVRKRIRSR